jgi:hypothetical protein
VNNRRLRKQLAALEARLDKHHPEPNPLLTAYARVIHALTRDSTMEWHYDEYGHLQRLEYVDAHDDDEPNRT